MANLIVDIQNATEYKNLPNQDQLELWINSALSFIKIEENEVELTIRLVDAEEIQSLNKDYRSQNKPTNVLSFPANYEIPDSSIYFMGDLVICLSVVETEAIEQKKSFEHHLTHMIIHGVLHLLGYDHIIDEEAEEMESLEIEILETLSIKNPYEI